MKKHLLLCAVAVCFGLSSCDYTPEPLPEYARADYELAFPIADTSVSVSDFFSLSSIPTAQIDFPKDAIANRVMDFPFYLADLTERAYTIEWLEPKAILNNELSQKLDVSFSCNITTKSGAVYELSRDQLLALGKSELFSGKRILSSDFSIANANRVYLAFAIRAKENVPIEEIQQTKLKLDFGIKVRLHLTYSLK